MARLAGGDANPHRIQELLGHRGRRPEAVGQLGPQFRHGLGALRGGEALVQGEALVDFGHVLLRQEALGADADHRLDGGDRRLTPQFSHGLPEKLRVKIVAHGGDVAVLLGAQQVARAADLEVAHGELEARAQLGQLLEHPQPPLGLLVHAPVGRDQKVGVGLLALAAHAAAELVELGQTEAVGPVDDDGVGRGDVQARLHDGRGHQDIGLAGDEPHHGRLQLALLHLAVGHDDARVGHQLLDEAHHGGQRLDAVVDEEHLAAAGQLALDGLLDHGLAEAPDVRLHGQALQRRRLDDRHVAHPGQRHVEGARNRGRGHGQHVHRRPQLLHPLLVGHAEPVLLVDDEEAEVLEGDVLGEQAVRPHDHVHRALPEALDHGLLLLGGAEAREQLHARRERRRSAR